MKSLLLTAIRVPATIYLLLGFGFFLSVADNHFGRIRMLPLPPTLLALVFLLSTSGLVVLSDLLESPPLGRVSKLISANWPITGAMFGIAFFSLLSSFSEGSYWGENSKWIYLHAYSVSIFFLALLLPLLPLVRKHFRALCFAGFLALLCSIAGDLITPGTFSVEINRAAGFPGNSNWGALALVMLGATTLNYDSGSERLKDFGLLLLMGLGVFATLSRSGMLNFAALSLFYCCRVLLSSRDGLRSAMSIAAGAAISVAIALATIPVLVESSDMFAGSNAVNRILVLFEGKVVDDGSSGTRIDAAQEALQLIEEAPILGHGTGHSRLLFEKPHNLFLKQWLENGLPGLCMWLILLIGGFVVFKARSCPQGMALMITAFVGSFFSHNILQQRTFLLLLGGLTSLSYLRAKSRSR